MPKTIEVVKKEHERSIKNYKKHIFVLALIIVFAASLFVTVGSHAVSREVENILFSNDVKLKTDYDLEMDVIPNILYPEGGYVKPQGNNMPTKVIKDLRVSLNTSFTGTQEAKFIGTYDIYFILTAEDLWVKEYPLLNNESFNITGKQGALIQEKVTIPLQDILQLIEQVESELNVYPRSYTGKLKVIYNGDIESGGESRLLDAGPEINFDLSDRNLLLLGIINEELNYSIKDIEAKENMFDLAGIAVPVKRARLFSTLLSVALFIVIAVMSVIKIKLSYYNNTTEGERIERKLKRRLVELDASPNFSGSNIIILKSHEDLMKIADENEQPIMLYREPLENNFFVTGNNCIYMFIVKNSFSA